MTTEQILIRMGVDAKAVVVGLNKVSAYVKAWGTGLASSLKSSFGKFLIPALAVGAFVKLLSSIKDKIIEIKNLSYETGASTNFIQSIMMAAERAGMSVTAFTEPLKKLNALIGDAKRGMPDAAIKLHDLGIVTKANEIKTLSLNSALAKLADKYRATGDAQLRANLLERAGLDQGFGKVLEGGSAGINSMNSFNPFTKISAGAIGDFGDAWKGIKATTGVVLATVANIIDLPALGVRKLSQFFGALSGGARSLKDIGKSMSEAEEKRKDEAAEAALQNQADQEGISVQEKKAQIITTQNELLLRQKELTAEISDRNKTSIQEMADHARKFLGIIDPKRLNFTVSQRDRMALNIDQKEKQAQVAFERGDDRTFRRLTSEALQLRHGFSAASFKDREPMLKTEIELQKVNLQLAPVARMAEFVNQEHKTPK